MGTFIVMKISVIIPTYNEEAYLPKLLQCLRVQTMDEFEVIVADADSTDRTPEIARKYGARVIPGGMPAVGRNAGARAAKGDYFFFFDADVKFSKHFLQRAYNEMQERFIDLATCEARPLSNVPLDRIMHRFANMYLRLNQYTNPMAPGYCILIHSRLFERTGGFDETIKLAEDFDLVKRAAKLRPFRVLDSVHINVSVRRYRKEGRLAFMGHTLAVSWHRTFRGEITSDDFEYEFGEYDEKDASSRIRQIEKGINNLSRRYRRLAKRLERSGNGEGIQPMQERLKELYARVWDRSQEDDSTKENAKDR
jgi:glycosyltransferase involved in cell wall biosynthesis